MSDKYGDNRDHYLVHRTTLQAAICLYRYLAAKEAAAGGRKQSKKIAEDYDAALGNYTMAHCVRSEPRKFAESRTLPDLANEIEKILEKITDLANADAADLKAIGKRAAQTNERW